MERATPGVSQLPSSIQGGRDFECIQTGREESHQIETLTDNGEPCDESRSLESQEGEQHSRQKEKSLEMMLTI